MDIKEKWKIHLVMNINQENVYWKQSCTSNTNFIYNCKTAVQQNQLNTAWAD